MRNKNSHYNQIKLLR